MTIRSASEGERRELEYFWVVCCNQAGCEEIQKHVSELLKSNAPFVTTAAMMKASDWVRLGLGGSEKRSERLACLLPFVDRCLASKEPFIRMAGAMALLSLGEDKRLKSELERDSSFLLVRPEPETDLPNPPGPRVIRVPVQPESDQTKESGPSSQADAERLLKAVSSVSMILGARSKLIEACGRLRIQASVPTLKAIAADSSGKWGVDETAKVAKEAIAVIEGSKAPSDLSGAEFLPAVPEKRSETGPPSISARVTVRTVPPLTEEQAKLVSTFVATLESDPDELKRHLELALATGHPYVVARAVDAVGEWSYHGSGGVAGRGDRVAILMPHIEQFLKSSDAFERLAGVVGLVRIGELGRVRTELERDSSFLLTRPERASVIAGDNIGRAQSESINRPVDEILFLQLEVLTIAGRLKVAAARPTLESIIVDARERRDSVTEGAGRRSLSQMDTGR